jgi:NodT family efflux transporter outer membrane factor (OMF) lipoprotein
MVKLGITLLLLLLSGCAVGPRYKKPDMLLPQSYSVQIGQENPKDAVCWWKAFNDPIMEGLIEKGLSQNYDFKIALEKIEAARNLYRIDYAKIFPQINLFSDVLKANLGNGIFSRGVPTGNVTSKFIAIDTLWEIDLWGRLRSNKNASQYQWEAQIEDMRDVLIILAAEIAQTYINICSLYKQIQVLSSSLKVDIQLLDLNKVTFKSGIDEELIFLEQETSVDAFTTQIIDLQAAQKIALNKLAFLLGQNPDQIVLDLNNIQDVPLPWQEVSVDKPYELLRRRPDIRKAERLLAASYEQIGSAMAEWFPKISLLGFLGKPHNSGGNIQLGGLGGNDKIWAIGPLLEWPILDFGRIYFNIRVKESEQRQALLTYEKAVVNALQDVENRLTSYDQEKKKMNYLQKKWESEGEKLRLARDRFTSGVDSELAFLVVEKRINELSLEIINSEEKIASNFVALYKAFGGDW